MRLSEYSIPSAIPLDHAVVGPQPVTAFVVLHLSLAIGIHTRNGVSWTAEWLVEACVHLSANKLRLTSMFDRDVRRFHGQQAH